MTANTTTIIIEKYSLKPPFFSIRKDSLLIAIRNLNEGALKLYLYLASNKEGYQLELINSRIVEDLKITPRDIRQAFDVLKEKGFLIPRNENCFAFYERGGKGVC